MGWCYFKQFHAMQVPSGSRIRGVYRIVDIQINETRDLPTFLITIKHLHNDIVSTWFIVTSPTTHLIVIL